MCQGFESKGLTRGQHRQHFAIDPDVFGLQAMHEGTVCDSMLSCPGTDPLYPELPKFAFLLSAAFVLKDQRSFDPWTGNSDAVLASTLEPLGQPQHRCLIQRHLAQ